MVMRNQADDQEIVAEGKDEEGRIENAEDKRAQVAKVKQKVKERAKPMRHAMLFLQSND